MTTVADYMNSIHKTLSKVSKRIVLVDPDDKNEELTTAWTGVNDAETEVREVAKILGIKLENS